MRSRYAALGAALACAAAAAAVAALLLRPKRAPAPPADDAAAAAAAAVAAPFPTTILLIDNGSLHAASYLSLCAMAEAVSAATGLPVLPASARFADRIPPGELQGRAGETLAGALARALAPAAQAAGARRRHILILPAFFGPADPLKKFVPEQVALAGARAAEAARAGGGSGAPPLRVTHSLARPLAAPGEARLAAALAAGVVGVLQARALAPEGAAVALCDHGSPSAEVGRVRGLVAGQLAEALRAAGVLARLRAPLAQASMERREGSEYDFNEPSLAALLRSAPFNEGDVVLALLFLSPGAHAGPGGDIDQIVAEAVAEAAGQGRALRVHRTPLLAPSVTGILADRLREAMAELAGSEL
jgi:hypothetical protein